MTSNKISKKDKPINDKLDMILATLKHISTMDNLGHLQSIDIRWDSIHNVNLSGQVTNVDVVPNVSLTFHASKTDKVTTMPNCGKEPAPPLCANVEEDF